MKHYIVWVSLLLLAPVHTLAQPVNGDAAPPAGSTGAGGDTTDAADPTATALAQANASKAMYDAQTSAANAQKAAIDAKTEAAKAAFGTVTGTTNTLGGSTTAGTNASQAEATLLVTRSARMAAADMAAALNTNIAGKKILVLTDISQLSTSDAMQFDMQLSIVTTALKAASNACTSAISKAKKAPPVVQSHFAPALVGAALDAGAKALSYFQTDYNFTGVTVNDPANLTAGTVAEAIIGLKNSASVVIPSNLLASDAQPVIDKLSPIEDSYAKLVGYEAEVKGLAAANKDQSISAELNQADAQANKAITNYESFMSGIIAAPATGVEAPIVRIVRGKLIQAQLTDASTLVLLVVDQKIAENYTKKNLWTFFGGPPLYTMGGISSVYILYSPSSSIVVAAGAIPRHGGYKSVAQVQKLFP